MALERAILSVDPGKNHCAAAHFLVDGNEVVLNKLFWFSHTRKVGDSGYIKFNYLYEFFYNIVEQVDIDVCVFEAVHYSRNIVTYKNLAQSIVSAYLGVLRYHDGIMPFKEYRPTEAKMAATGNGAASKEEVALAVGEKFNLHIDSDFSDEYDAIAVGLSHILFSPKGIQQVLSKDNSQEADILKRSVALTPQSDVTAAMKHSVYNMVHEKNLIKYSRVDDKRLGVVKHA